MLIVLEGPDGCGKTTVARAVAKALGTRGGTDATFYQFPNDEGVTGPMIRAYLAKKWSINVSKQWEDEAATMHGLRVDADLAGALAFQALQVMNRMEVMSHIRRMSVTEHVVCARYWQSGYVYGSLDGLDPEWLIKVHETMEQADLNILLDIDAETALERQVERGADPERYEGKATFTSAVVEAYRELWAKHIDQSTNGKVQELDWPIVDASQSAISVVADVMKLVMQTKEAEDA